MKAVCIISGGMDSTTLLHQLAKQPGRDFELFALSINYGQRHVKELACAAIQCAELGVRHKIVDATVLLSLLGGSSLTDDSVAVPEGHYAADNMKATVVPNRNMILLALAAGFGISQCGDDDSVLLAYGAHAGDHEIYPDCRFDFVEAMAKVLALADWKKVELYAPFLKLAKTDIVTIGANLGVDFAQTWTCYKGGEIACGKCGTCVERLEAFNTAGRVDPLEYEDRDYWRDVVIAAKGSVRVSPAKFD